MKFLDTYRPQIFAAARIVFGSLFAMHGLQKVFMMFGGAPAEMPDVARYVIGGIELVGGAMIAIGLMTRWAAFVSSGLMAAAYWMAHGTNALLPIANQGELAVLYCFIFLVLASQGSGIWSVDAMRGGGADAESSA